jgi:hypothetical protein
VILKSGIKIRVFMGSPPSGAPDNFVSSPPVTMVNVTRGDEDARGGDAYLALIDTGADYVAIDKGVVERINATKRGSAIEGRGLCGMRANLNFAHISLFFLSANLIFEVPQAAIVGLREDGNQFDLVLGRCFLRHCLLTVDGPNTAYDLEWVDNHQPPQSS